MINPKLGMYRIVPGQSFRMPDGEVKGPGEKIKLDEEGARQHGDKLEFVEAVEPDSGSSAE